MNKREQNVGGVISYFVIVLFLIYVAFSILGFDNEVKILTSLGIIFISTFFLCFFVLRTYRRNNSVNEIDYLNSGTQRYLLALFMIFYGLPKIFGTFFDYQLFALDSKLIDVSDFELAWYYFGKNRWQELFAGFMELIPAFLLLNRRTYYLGAIFLLPVTSQVFILNLFFKIGGVTFPAATILLVCNIYLVYTQKDKIILFIKSLNFNLSTNLNHTAIKFIKIARWSAALLVVILFCKNLKPQLYKSPEKLNYEKLIGAYSLETIVKNNALYNPKHDSLFYKDIYIEKQSRWNILRRFNDKTDAFVINVSSENDSLAIYINQGGIGDDKDIIDSTTVLKGIYKINGNEFLIKGIQLNDTLEVTYRNNDKIKPKRWFW